MNSRIGLSAIAFFAVVAACTLAGLLLTLPAGDGAAGGSGGYSAQYAQSSPISYPSGVAAAGLAIAADQQERREHVIDLPEDGGAWSLTIVYATDDHTSPADRRLRAAFWSSARLRSLVAQTNTTTYKPSDKLWQSKYREAMGDVLPQVWLQDDKGKVVYKASGDNIPSYYPDQMANEIQLSIDQLVRVKYGQQYSQQYSQQYIQGQPLQGQALNTPRGQYSPQQVPPSQQSQQYPYLSNQNCPGPNCPPNYRPQPQPQPSPQPQGPGWPNVNPWNNSRIPDIRPIINPGSRAMNYLPAIVSVVVVAGVLAGLLAVLVISALAPKR